MGMTAEQMREALKDCGRGSILFVSYEAGNLPTDRALLESERAVYAEGMARRHYVGTFHGMWTTSKGQIVMTIMAFNRDRLTGHGLVEGGYRTFNPAIGSLLSLEIVELVPGGTDTEMEDGV